MKRRVPRRQTHGPASPRSQPVNYSRAIVPVDGTAIRRKIKKGYEKALRDLDASRRQLDQFHQADLPRFTRWLNAHFGALLTELREVSQKLAAADELVFQVETEMMFGVSSYARAYQRVMELREDPELPPPTNGDASSQGRKPFGERQEGGSTEDGEDPRDAFFKEIFGESGPGEGPRDEDGTPSAPSTKTAGPPHGVSRLKELYRALVRRLHPDSQRETTVQSTEWWHQTQAAYEAGDAEQLELILTLCEIGDNGTVAHTSASLLQRITAQLKNSLREIKRQIAARRNDPAWSFSLRTDHDAMALQMGRALTDELREMREHWQRTQELIAGWEAAAERLRPPRRRKRTPRATECPF